MKVVQHVKDVSQLVVSVTDMAFGVEDPRL